MSDVKYLRIFHFCHTYTVIKDLDRYCALFVDFHFWLPALLPETQKNWTILLLSVTKRIFAMWTVNYVQTIKLRYRVHDLGSDQQNNIIIVPYCTTTTTKKNNTKVAFHTRGAAESFEQLRDVWCPPPVKKKVNNLIIAKHIYDEIISHLCCCWCFKCAIYARASENEKTTTPSAPGSSVNCPTVIKYLYVIKWQRYLHITAVWALLSAGCGLLVDSSSRVNGNGRVIIRMSGLERRAWDGFIKVCMR